MSDYLHIGTPVRAALDAGQAVVALESTLITHSFPPMLNYEVAMREEAAVRAEGAVPATIGWLADGLSSA